MAVNGSLNLSERGEMNAVIALSIKEGNPSDFPKWSFIVGLSISYQPGTIAKMDPQVDFVSLLITCTFCTLNKFFDSGCSWNITQRSTFLSKRWNNDLKRHVVGPSARILDEIFSGPIEQLLTFRWAFCFKDWFLMKLSQNADCGLFKAKQRQNAFKWSHMVFPWLY